LRRPDDEDWIADMLAASLEAVELLAGSSSDQLRKDRVMQLALTHLVEIVGEAARRVSPETRSTMPAIPWHAITGMRNRLAHDYRHVDIDILHETIRADLPKLVSQLRSR
jgi:uncharacterized protein with HEPN domain